MQKKLINTCWIVLRPWSHAWLRASDQYINSSKPIMYSWRILYQVAVNVSTIEYYRDTLLQIIPMPLIGHAFFTHWCNSIEHILGFIVIYLRLLIWLMNSNTKHWASIMQNSCVIHTSLNNWWSKSKPAVLLLVLFVVDDDDVQHKPPYCFSLQKS